MTVRRHFFTLSSESAVPQNRLESALGVSGGWIPEAHQAIREIG